MNAPGKTPKARRLAALTLLLCLLLTLPVHAQQTKLVALTFDDGPSWDFTPAVLDVLAGYDVKATFFLVGQWLPDKEDLVRRTAEAGHQVASHTFEHIPLTDLTDGQIRAQMDAMEVALSRILPGQSQFMLRPPLGKCDKRVLSLLTVPAIH